MAQNEAFEVRVEIISPVHFGSGKGDVNIDAEVAHDVLGLPYFPAKRFKGLLYESALEVVEIMGDSPLFSADEVRVLFRHGQKAMDTDSVQMVMSNLRLEDYGTLQEEWGYLQKTYPELLQPQDVLEQYTSLRYQTKIDPKTGIASDTSLHNMRVVDKGVVFIGRMDLKNGGEKERRILSLAIRNLERAGLKRNRGFGKIRCTLTQDGKNVGGATIEAALREWKEANGQ